MILDINDFELSYKEYNRCRKLNDILESYTPKKPIHEYLIRVRNRFEILKNGELYYLYVYGDLITTFTYDGDDDLSLYIRDISETALYYNIKMYYSITFESSSIDFYRNLESFLYTYLTNSIKEQHNEQHQGI